MDKVFRVAALIATAATIGAAAPTVSRLSYTPEQVITVRQAGFEMSAVVFASLQRAGDSDTEPKKQGFFAGGLALWAKALPTLFPAGTATGESAADTQAKVDIWSNRADFERKAADYLAAANRLVAATHANDPAAFKAGLVDIKKACDACHADYKLRTM